MRSRKEFRLPNVAVLPFVQKLHIEIQGCVIVAIFWQQPRSPWHQTCPLKFLWDLCVFFHSSNVSWNFVFWTLHTLLWLQNTWKAVTTLVSTTIPIPMPFWREAIITVSKAGLVLSRWFVPFLNNCCVVKIILFFSKIFCTRDSYPLKYSPARFIAAANAQTPLYLWLLKSVCRFRARLLYVKQGLLVVAGVVDTCGTWGSSEYVLIQTFSF